MMLETEIRRVRFAPGLKVLRDPQVHLCIVLAPSFTPYVDWTLFREDETWRVRRYAESVLRGPKETYFAEGLPDPCAVEALLAALPQITLPLFDTRLDFIGLDGCAAKIEIFKGEYRSAGLSWWIGPPDDDDRGMEPVRAFMRSAIDLFQSCLPESTLSLSIADI
jgi:hypothetical protein